MGLDLLKKNNIVLVACGHSEVGPWQNISLVVWAELLELQLFDTRIFRHSWLSG